MSKTKQTAAPVKLIVSRKAIHSTRPISKKAVQALEFLKTPPKKACELTIIQIVAAVMVEVKKELAKERAASLKRERTLIQDIPAYVKLDELRNQPSKEQSNKNAQNYASAFFAGIRKELQAIEKS